MRIGELSRVTGTPVGAIRYYEEIGLLPEAERTGSGYRVFGEEHVRCMHFIRAARRLGLSLDQIREVLRAASDSRMPCTCVRGTVQRSIERIDQRVAELKAMRANLVRTLEVAGRTAASEALPPTVICPAIESVSISRPIAALDSPVDWRV